MTPTEKRKRREWAKEKAESLFHEWASQPGYEPMDEDMAINLVIRIRDALTEAALSREEGKANG